MVENLQRLLALVHWDLLEWALGRRVLCPVFQGQITRRQPYLALHTRIEITAGEEKGGCARITRGSINISETSLDTGLTSLAR